jgi:hypothetical protein
MQSQAEISHVLSSLVRIISVLQSGPFASCTNTIPDLAATPSSKGTPRNLLGMKVLRLPTPEQLSQKRLLVGKKSDINLIHFSI